MHPQRGNILFLILLAIILFVALNYAIMGSDRSGKNAAGEKARATASSMINYLTLLHSAIDRMRIVNGCSFENFDWRHGTYLRYNETLADNFAPETPKAGCAVFQAQGGPIAPQLFETSAYTDHVTPSGSSIKPGHMFFRWVNMLDAGTTDNDWAIIVSSTRLDVCMDILKSYDPTITAVPGDEFDSTTSRSAILTGSESGTIGEAAINKRMNGFWVDIQDNKYCRMGLVLLPF